MKNKNGFTLIELLVVVLIIGILASIALPQYQKAVIKARLVQLNVSVNAARKGIDMYLLSNGWPGEMIDLAVVPNPLDIEIPGESDGQAYRSKIGGMQVWISPESATIRYYSSLVNQGNANWFDDAYLVLSKRPGMRVWAVEEGQVDGATENSKMAILCRWVRENGFPAYSGTKIIDECAQMGVNLSVI